MSAEVQPYLASTRPDQFPRPLFSKLCEMGLGGIPFPAEHGGGAPGSPGFDAPSRRLHSEAATVSHRRAAHSRDAELGGGSPDSRATRPDRHGARPVAGAGARERRGIQAPEDARLRGGGSVPPGLRPGVLPLLGPAPSRGRRRASGRGLRERVRAAGGGRARGAHHWDLALLLLTREGVRPLLRPCLWRGPLRDSGRLQPRR